MGEKEMTEEVFWAANQKAPLTRDQQIEFMQTAKQRFEENVERWQKIEEDKKDG
jgi:nitrate reductase alpha subunit